MPPTKPLFFECFLACRSGPGTRNSHHTLTIYPACTLPKHAWNTILSTKSMFFVRFWHTEISLKRDALIKFSRFITPAPCQNSPETRCCRQNHSFHVSDGSKSAWNAKLSSNSRILPIFAASQNRPETQICKPYSSVQLFNIIIKCRDF